MKQRIQSDLKVSPRLKRLLAAAKKRVVTEEELREQRISFAYGNLALHDPRVTKDDIRRAAERIKLRDEGNHE